jgi:hypothetical protein
MNEDQVSEELGWYISDVHARRAIGYLSAKLVEDGWLPADFPSPLLLVLWGEALQETLKVEEPSPIGPEPEDARKFLLEVIEKRVERMEERGDRMEEAISTISSWLHLNLTRYGHKQDQEIEKILYGEEHGGGAKTAD